MSPKYSPTELATFGSNPVHPHPPCIGFLPELVVSECEMVLGTTPWSLVSLPSYRLTPALHTISHSEPRSGLEPLPPAYDAGTLPVKLTGPTFVYLGSTDCLLPLSPMKESNFRLQFTRL